MNDCEMFHLFWRDKWICFNPEYTKRLTDRGGTTPAGLLCSNTKMWLRWMQQTTQVPRSKVPE